jgi:multidrug efflux pump subunit AcrA (membrane-fusion protein)
MIRWRRTRRFQTWLQGLVLGILAAALLAGCSRPALSLEPAVARAEATVQASPAPQAIKGRLEPRLYTDLSVYEPGRVESILVKEGDSVEKGDVLLRLDSYAGYASERDAADVERVAAQQALKDLYTNAPTFLANAETVLGQAVKEQALAEDHLVSLQNSHNASRIAQAQANLLLAEKRMNDTKDSLRKAKQRYNNRHNPIWHFVSRHDYELLITLKEKAAAYAEGRYWDAKKKYEDLLKPVDAIDLALAEARLANANAALDQAQRERDKWLNGPAPDLLTAAQVRLKAAESRLSATQDAMQAAQVIAPISGVVANLNIKQGEEAIPGQTLAVVANLKDWAVVIPELGEKDVVHFQPGQEVRMSLDAYPEAELSGEVETISQYYILDNTDVFYQAKIDLQPSDLPLRWGMTVRVR